jgi:putative sigma-54 modulation protein
MIKHIDITAVQKTYTIDEDLTKYIQKKIGKLDKHISRKEREAARAEVKLQESTGKGAKKCTVEVLLYLPTTTLAAKESTINMFAAVDIVESKLQNQLKRTKEKASITNDGRKNSRARRTLRKIFSRKSD